MPGSEEHPRKFRFGPYELDEAARELRKRVGVSAPAGVTYVRVAPEEVQVIFPPDR